MLIASCFSLMINFAIWMFYIGIKNGPGFHGFGGYILLAIFCGIALVSAILNGLCIINGLICFQSTKQCQRDIRWIVLTIAIMNAIATLILIHLAIGLDVFWDMLRMLA